MDIKAEVEKIIGQVTKDGDIKEKFAKDPAGTVKGLVGDNVDKETLNKIVEMVKAAIAKGDLDLGAITGKIKEVIGGAAIGSLLGGAKKDDAPKEEGK